MTVPRWIAPIIVLLALAGCSGDYVPREKATRVDPQTGALDLPYPCPDWSHNPSVNFDNSVHSNYGCATANNLAVQLEDPRDLVRGHGTPGPDAGITADAVARYRAGEIPAEFTPEQDVGGQ